LLVLRGELPSKSPSHADIAEVVDDMAKQIPPMLDFHEYAR
jgi:hypothetical protein